MVNGWPDDATARVGLQRAIEEAANMVVAPALFSPEELLAQLIDATRICIESAGILPEEGERRRLYVALVAYGSVPGTDEQVRAHG